MWEVETSSFKWEVWDIFRALARIFTAFWRFTYNTAGIFSFLWEIVTIVAAHSVTCVPWLKAVLDPGQEDIWSSFSPIQAQTALVKVWHAPVMIHCSPRLSQVTLLLSFVTSSFGNPSAVFATKHTRNNIFFNLLWIVPLHWPRSPYLEKKGCHLREPFTTQVWFVPCHSGEFAHSPKGVGSSCCCWPRVLEAGSGKAATQSVFCCSDIQSSAWLCKASGFYVLESTLSKMQRHLRRKSKCLIKKSK